MESVQSHSNSWIGRFDEMAEFNRYGIMSIGLLLVGCSGGAVVGMFGFDAIWKLALIVTTSMFSLTMMLAIAPIKLVTRSIALALVVDLFVLIASLV